MVTAMHNRRSGLVALAFLGLGWGAGALGAEAPAAASPTGLTKQDMMGWTARFPVAGSQIQKMEVAQQIRSGQDMHPFSGRAVVGVALTGTVRLASKRSMVRVVLIDDQQKEYLVYETYPLLASAATFKLESGCRETCALPPTVPVTLKIELVEASVDIEAVIENRAPPKESARADMAAQMQQQAEQIKKEQDAQIVDVLNNHIKAQGLRWTAGETSLSRLSFAERERLVACVTSGLGAGPNLQGAEFYKGGIFEVESGNPAPSNSASASSTAIVDSFDWRSRHGANRPGSPYFNGFNGWLTPVENQLCADCWAHSALGATEAQVNLYFNQHLDLDLSEQELVNCSGAGSCQFGGNTGSALSYVQNYGVVDEACLPENGRDEPCNVCPVPQDRVRIAGFDFIYPDELDLQRRLIKYGPLPFGIASWWHALVLAGYEHDAVTGQIVWILKNSWGQDWGDHGYGYIVVPVNDIYLTYDLHSPVTSLIKSYDVECRDADGDGYYNWGISEKPPASCGDVPPIEDCDDSDPTVALMTETGACVAVPDKVPPVVSARADPSVLWPPNGATVQVLISGNVKDTGSGVDTGKTSYAVKDEYGRISPSGSVQVGPDGNYVVKVPLQASRLGSDKDGRQYIVTVTARDKAGNVGSGSTTVTVPHDSRPGK